jgi:major membrane immunogen (membrane-anchored lipoprotein)
MYNVKRLAVGLSTVLIFTMVITACSQSKTSGSQNLFSKNRLANTTWEGHLTAFGDKLVIAVDLGSSFEFKRVK